MHKVNVKKPQTLNESEKCTSFCQRRINTLKATLLVIESMNLQSEWSRKKKQKKNEERENKTNKHNDGEKKKSVKNQLC